MRCTCSHAPCCTAERAMASTWVIDEKTTAWAGRPKLQTRHRHRHPQGRPAPKGLLLSTTTRDLTPSAPATRTQVQVMDVATRKIIQGTAHPARTEQFALPQQPLVVRVQRRRCAGDGDRHRDLKVLGQINIDVELKAWP